MTDGVDKPLDELGEVGESIARIRARLKEGGPAIEYATLYAYIDEDLSPVDMQEVKRRIVTWKTWHDEYWNLRAGLSAVMEATASQSESAEDVAAWLTVMLDQKSSTNSTAHAWGMLLITSLARCVTLRIAGRTRSELGTSSVSLKNIEEQMTRGEPVWLVDSDHWLHVVEKDEAVEIRLGRNPANAFESFRVEFRCGSDTVVVGLTAEQGLLRITRQDFEDANRGAADRVVIVV